MNIALVQKIIKDLSKKVGLKNPPHLVVNYRKIKGIYASTNRSSEITLAGDLIKKQPKQVLEGAIAHEIAHFLVKGSKALSAVEILLLILGVILFGNGWQHMMAGSILTASFLALAAFIPVTIVVFVIDPHNSRLTEYQADHLAATLVGAKKMISVLKLSKQSKTRFWHTHPNKNDRIKKLMEIK